MIYEKEFLKMNKNNLYFMRYNIKKMLYNNLKYTI